MTTQLKALKIDETRSKTVDSNWRSLYKAGGAGALIVGTFFLIEMIFYITTSAPRRLPAPASSDCSLQAINSPFPFSTSIANP